MTIVVNGSAIGFKSTVITLLLGYTSKHMLKYYTSYLSVILSSEFMYT